MTADKDKDAVAEAEESREEGTDASIDSPPLDSGNCDVGLLILVRRMRDTSLMRTASLRASACGICSSGRDCMISKEMTYLIGT